jgi:hypothetical protein
MTNKFTKKIARKIANNSLVYVLDCLLGYDDSGYNLSSEGHQFETNFTEDLEALDITATPKRVEIITQIFDTEIDKVHEYIRKKQNSFMKLDNKQRGER